MFIAYSNECKSLSLLLYVFNGNVVPVINYLSNYALRHEDVWGVEI
jgi:hypothetical protein